MHADALGVLDRWAAPNDDQEKLRSVYQEHLRSHVDGVWRSCQPDHVTASALIIDADARKVALTYHTKARRWLQTGGHCEPTDSTLAAAALREACEESGIDDLFIDPVPVWLSRHEVPFCGTVQPAHHLDVQFLVIAQAGAQLTPTAESLDLAWWDVNSDDGVAADPTDNSVRTLIRASIARLRGNLEP